MVRRLYVNVSVRHNVDVVATPANAKAHIQQEYSLWVTSLDASKHLWLFCVWVHLSIICSAISNKSLPLWQENKLWEIVFFFSSLCSEKPFILELVLHTPTISIKSIILLSLRDSFLETCIPRGQWQARLWESRWTLKKTVSSLSLFDKEIKLFFPSGLNASMCWKGLFT